MTLIKSISGFRGTIGGKVADNLTPPDIVGFAAGYGQWIKENWKKENYKIVVGRDARISGSMVSQLVCSTLSAMGIDVIDLGLSTTPTVEMMVPYLVADGGIILTASHNPKQWNALKLLNNKGEFISASDGEALLKIVESSNFDFSDVDSLGKYSKYDSAIELHIERILELPYVDVNAIKERDFTVVVDAVNSTGGIAIPLLLEKLGVNFHKLYCEPNGDFPHNPEPLKEHLGDLSAMVVSKKADFGITVDPDVDRLALVNEDGSMFGEEYTLVAVADYVLELNPSDTVSNMSSTRALADVTQKYGRNYHASAVGEVNVVEKMKEVGAKIGGEGNGGIILPELHYGRDALVGIAIFLTLLAKRDMSCKELRDSYPSYFMSKTKIELTPELDVDGILEKIALHYKDQKVSTIDGVKIDFEKGWIHLRKSNTEPIIRIYTEAQSQELADKMGQEMQQLVKTIS
ncbi:MAG: phosphoglucosamine mutase [Flavobacteriaceae bacterium]|nr:MAG: phosphoglucosamine mutase [Flavobacteriaceae bacterium]